MVQGGYQDIVAGTIGNLPHQGTNGADSERRKEQSKHLHQIGLYEHLMQNASGSGQYQQVVRSWKGSYIQELFCEIVCLDIKTMSTVQNNLSSSAWKNVFQWPIH